MDVRIDRQQCHRSDDDHHQPDAGSRRAVRFRGLFLLLADRLELLVALAQGIELGLVGRITPAWQLSFGLTSQDTEVTDGSIPTAGGPSTQTTRLAGTVPRAVWGAFVPAALMAIVYAALLLRGPFDPLRASQR